MAELGIEVAMDAANAEPTITVSVDGDPVPVESTDDGVIRGTSTRAAAGRHVVRLECIAREATIRWLDFQIT
jgi:hypothetical protein